MLGLSRITAPGDRTARVNGFRSNATLPNNRRAEQSGEQARWRPPLLLYTRIAPQSALIRVGDNLDIEVARSGTPGDRVALDSSRAPVRSPFGADHRVGPAPSRTLSASMSPLPFDDAAGGARGEPCSSREQRSSRGSRPRPDRYGGTVNPERDDQRRLGALRHPASGPAGSVHYAQHQLAAAVKAFLMAMARAENPGAQPLPPPPGREQWPRHHRARRIEGWPTVTAEASGYQDWIGTDGQWWRLQYTATRALVDAFPIGSPVVVTADLRRYTDALDHLLQTCAKH